MSAWSAIRLAALLVGIVWPAAVQARLYALVIGIDAYQHITQLKGAVNDAVDISAAIGGLEPAETVLLLNEQATRDAILGNWRRLLEKAAPGDTVLVTYAGHGSNEPAAYPETEADGRDETLLLAGFAPSGAAAAERIRDNEIGALMDLRPDVLKIFVADSCHSGTATRATPFGLGY